VAVVGTPQGEIVWRFLEGEAPGHAAYVKELIRRGFYDGTTFHRVIPHFVIQGGDPLSNNDDRSDDGEGEADRRLKAEFSTTLHYRPGSVGMARDADPDSGSCQFFIAIENLPRLDGRYTIFGEVISGLDVARRIADLPRDLNDNPLQPVKTTVRLERREVPAAILSLEAGEAGETITGPGRPKPYDPGNVMWKPPVLQRSPADASARVPAPSGEPVQDPGERRPAAVATARAAMGDQRSGDGPPVRIEVAVAADGTVLDVRFPSLDTPRAAALRERALGWRFQPVIYDGAPQKTRFEIESDGTVIGPPTGGGAPVEITTDVTAPRPAVRVDLAAGLRPPEKAPRLRLVIDAEGNVADASLQSGSGDAALDAAALEAARKMIFAPATRPAPGKKEPQKVAVYLDVEARFVEAPK